MASKYVDTTAIVQVVGSVFNNPTLLDQTDKYVITEDDFVESFHKIVFGSIYKLYKLGVTEIKLQNIVDFLRSRPKHEAVFKQNNGEEWIKKTSACSIEAAFDYYYNRLKKFSLLRAYDNYGIDVSDIYDINNILDGKKKQIQEEYLDSSSLEQIASRVDNKISEIKARYIENQNLEESVQAGTDIDQLIDKYKQCPEVGIPLYGSLINTITRGARLRKFYLRSAPTGIGKAIPNTTLVPTPTGYRLVSDIQVGDELFDEKGRPTKVKQVFPQASQKQIYEVVFGDGRIAHCCKEHLWEVYVNGIKKVQTTEDLISILKENTVEIPNSQAVQYPKKQLFIDPYKYGAMVGNGLIFMGDGVPIPQQELPVGKALVSTIPIEIMEGSVEQRENFLNGFLATLGEEHKAWISFMVYNETIMKDIVQLCYSLGHSCTFAEDLQKFIFVKNVASIPIAQINILNEWTDMTCFEVDSPSHLFLINDYIVTHNTRSMVADACNFACNKLYNLDQQKWLDNGIEEPTLFITTEQDADEIQTMMLAFLSGVNEEHILNGEYLEGEEERVRQAGNCLKTAPLFIEELPDFSLQDVEDVIRKNIREHGVKYVVHDYIHTSLKILEEITRRSGGVKLREDNILFMLSTKLKDLCNQLGVFILSATQLNGQYTESDTPDQNLLRGAKSIADKIDVGYIILNVKNEDLVALNPILKSNLFDIPTIKLSIYKNRRGRYKSVYLWCKADLGCCRIDPLFCTNYNYEILSINDTDIQVMEEGAF